MHRTQLDRLEKGGQPSDYSTLGAIWAIRLGSAGSVLDRKIVQGGEVAYYPPLLATVTSMSQ
jgi:hypothetical protein